MNIVAFIISVVLFVGGFYLMGEAFAIDENQGLLFFAGIIVTSLGIIIPIHVLKRIDA